MTSKPKNQPSTTAPLQPAPASSELFSVLRSTLWGLLLALAALAVVYWLALKICNYGLIDDAYISLRYARNLALGNGLVFNLGERVEGYTNFLWTILLVPAFWLKMNVPLAAKIMGEAAGFGCLLVLYFLSQNLLAPRTTVFRSLIAPVCLAVQMPFLCYAQSGMEVTLFTLLLLGNLYFIFAGLENSRRFFLATLCLALAALTRPEAPVLFALNLLFWVYLKIILKKKLSWLLILTQAAVYLAIVGAYFAWRHHYYGYWLPNTYYAKVSGLHFSLIQKGWAYVWKFATLTYAVFLLPLLLLIRAFRKSPRYLYLASAACVYLAAVVLEGGDHLAMFRFCVPVLPILALLYQELWAQAVEHKVYEYVGPLKPAGLRALLFLPPVAAGLVASILAGFSLGQHNMTEYARSKYEVSLAENWAVFGQWLRSVTQGNETIALITVGAIPYYSELRAIDMVGLTDAHIAHLPLALGSGYTGHEKFDNAYVLAQRPQFILANHRVMFDEALNETQYARQAFFRAHEELVDDPDLQKNYQYTCLSIAPDTFFCLYVLKGFPFLQDQQLGIP